MKASKREISCWSQWEKSSQFLLGFNLSLKIFSVKLLFNLNTLTSKAIQATTIKIDRFKLSIVCWFKSILEKCFDNNMAQKTTHKNGIKVLKTALFEKFRMHTRKCSSMADFLSYRYVCSLFHIPLSCSFLYGHQYVLSYKNKFCWFDKSPKFILK